jgi:hypothetical protein
VVNSRADSTLVFWFFGFVTMLIKGEVLHHANTPVGRKKIIVILREDLRNEGEGKYPALRAFKYIINWLYACKHEYQRVPVPLQ